MRLGRALMIWLSFVAVGCGTTRVTDTTRTATEQLLVSNSVDEAVSRMDFRPLAGKAVFFDQQYLDNTVDKGYLVSSLRQHLLASGCLLMEDRTLATYVVEARAGAVGTDRHDLLFGIPAFNIPTTMPGYPSGLIPEIPIAKKSDKIGVAKVAVFAYNRTTGKPIWQSGIEQTASTSKDTWIAGLGPFQTGTIHDGTKFAGADIQLPLLGHRHADEDEGARIMVPVTREASFKEQPPKEPIIPASTTHVDPTFGSELFD